MSAHLFTKNDNAGGVRLSQPLELKLAAADLDAGLLTGYGSTFNGAPDSYGDVIAPGAFTNTIAEHQAAGTMPAMLWAHEHAQPIGRWVDMRQDAKGLHMVGRLNLSTTRGQDAYAHIKAKDVTGLSMGYVVPSGGRTKNADGSHTLKEVHLVETSAVAAPADTRARITGVKSVESRRDLEQLLHDGGLPRAAAVKVAAGGWPALAGSDDDAEAHAIAERITRAAQSLRTS